uniref:Uncharacterized protein n=1 Tax=Ditylenchus dipsaci TaxID=166011 RepID=A0A915EA01_9BILA
MVRRRAVKISRSGRSDCIRDGLDELGVYQTSARSDKLSKNLLNSLKSWIRNNPIFGFRTPYFCGALGPERLQPIQQFQHPGLSIIDIDMCGVTPVYIASDGMFRFAAETDSRKFYCC